MGEKKKKTSPQKTGPPLAAQKLVRLQHCGSEPLGLQFQHFWLEHEQQQHWQHAVALAASRAWNTSCVTGDSRSEPCDRAWFCDVLTTICSNQEICECGMHQFSRVTWCYIAISKAGCHQQSGFVKEGTSVKQRHHLQYIQRAYTIYRSVLYILCTHIHV